MLNINDLRNKNDMGPIIKIVLTFEMVMLFSLIVAISSFIGFLFVPVGSFIAGELYGISLFASFIFIVMFGTLLSCVPPEVIEELKRQIEEEIEKKKNEKKK